MEMHSRQLIRLGELIGMSADALRDLITVHIVESEIGTLGSAADDLDRIASVVSQAGRRSVAPT